MLRLRLLREKEALQVEPNVSGRVWFPSIGTLTIKESKIFPVDAIQNTNVPKQQTGLAKGNYRLHLEFPAERIDKCGN